MNTSVNSEDLKIAYRVVSQIMDENKFNYVTAWKHVKAELAMIIADRA